MSSTLLANSSWDAADTAMVVMMVLFLALLVLGFTVLRPWRARRTTSRVTARETLDRRLEAGEIDKDDYDQRRAALGGTT